MEKPPSSAPPLSNFPPPGPGEVRVRQLFSGVNYVDIYHRRGLHALPGGLPATLGVEGVGTVEAVGAGVTRLAPGQSVAHAGPPVGSYASVRNLPAERLLPLPEDVPPQHAAAALLRGITAHMLFTRVRPLQPGDTVLVHAAAGGLGLILTQWARQAGARVIGTVGDETRADLARAHGLDHAILYQQEDFVAATLRLTDGQGADYVIDGIGGETLAASLAATRPFGMAASIGQVAGSLPPLDPALLDHSRSIALARPGVFAFMADPARYREGALATLAQLQNGLKVRIEDILPLAEAAEAHRRLEAGGTSGALLLQM